MLVLFRCHIVLCKALFLVLSGCEVPSGCDPLLCLVYCIFLFMMVAFSDLDLSILKSVIITMGSITVAMF